MTQDLTMKDIIYLLIEMKNDAKTLDEAINVGCGFENLEIKWDSKQVAEKLIDAVNSLQYCYNVLHDINEAPVEANVDVYSEYIQEQARLGIEDCKKII